MSKKLEGIGLNGMEFSSNEYLIGTHGNQNPWGRFCYLNSAAHPAHLPQKWTKGAKLAVQFSW